MTTPMRSATLHNEFVGEGYFDLRLGIGELIQLQEKLGCGPSVIAGRFLTNEWLVQDIQETIRLALIGGGMSQQDAHGLVQRCVIEGHLMDFTGLAGNVLLAALSGIEEEPLSGEATAPTPRKKKTRSN